MVQKSMQQDERYRTGLAGAGEQLSAAMDGEWAGASAAGVETTLARLTADDRQRWAVYHALGDVLRSEEMAATVHMTQGFGARFAARLDAEPAIVAPVAGRGRAAAQAGARAGSGWSKRWNGASAGRWLSGQRVMPSFAAAAAMAALAWIVVPSLHGSNAVQPVATIASASRDGGWQRVNLSADRQLDPYLEAHQQFASDRGGFGYASLDSSGH